MGLHIIKLSVGTDSLEDLLGWQKGRLKATKSDRLVHITRMQPKRRDEILNGGSIYWVVKGQIIVRQRILDLTEVDRNGVPHCGIVYDPIAVPVARRSQRAFQGWRYLNAADAPSDLPAGALNLPPELQGKLLELGLI